ncbi:hypothetical protein HDV05_003626 [Chytridiales sp. JEL 0842]|nr:hypothetical protein HDV05_003626 [Chytridiales sp. JEL 0842]
MTSNPSSSATPPTTPLPNPPTSPATTFNSPKPFPHFLNAVSVLSNVVSIAAKVFAIFIKLSTSDETADEEALGEVAELKMLVDLKVVVDDAKLGAAEVAEEDGG